MAHRHLSFKCGSFHGASILEYSGVTVNTIVRSWLKHMFCGHAKHVYHVWQLVRDLLLLNLNVHACE